MLTCSRWVTLVGDAAVTLSFPFIGGAMKSFLGVLSGTRAPSAVVPRSGGVAQPCSPVCAYPVVF